MATFCGSADLSCFSHSHVLIIINIIIIIIIIIIIQITIMIIILMVEKNDDQKHDVRLTFVRVSDHYRGWFFEILHHQKDGLKPYQ